MDEVEAGLIKEPLWKRFLLQFKEPYIAWGMICGFVMNNIGRNFKWPYLSDYLFKLFGG